MPLKIVLLTPRRQFIANRSGLGYQIPLGLVLLGGPLLDAGHRVWLIDNDVRGWDDATLVAELARLAPDCVLLGHTGSTAAHPVAIQTARALRDYFPYLKIVYGGVYPTYAAQSVLAENSAVDVIVCGEGEVTTLNLMRVLEQGGDLATVAGIAWRNGARVKLNPARPPITCLDEYRPGWELVTWEDYQLFGFGRAAGMQFSRGCPLDCAYCGQWAFWRKWRHRSPANVAQELTQLRHRYDVRIVWFADENFGADPAVAQALLQQLVERNLGLSLNVNLTAADVARDTSLMPLYKRAGVDNVVMGIEAFDDAVLASVRKNNPVQVSTQAVQALRANHIVSLVNVIYGLAHESPATLWRTLTELLALDPDVVNAVYLTPHFWTPLGKAARASDIIQPDQARWTYRNQVIHTPELSPTQLFLGVKLTEGLFHTRPRALWRMAFDSDARFRQILREYFLVGARVVLAELAEFMWDTAWVQPHQLVEVPGYPRKQSVD